jgi:hypothetical protein
MARVPLDQRTPLAQWLIRARASQGESYTVDRFLAELRGEAGSAPSRSNYAQWESGAVTPRESNLEPVIRFWAKRGLIGPEGPAQVVENELAAAIRAQTAAIQENTAMVARLLEQLVPLAARGLQLGTTEAVAAARVASTPPAASPERQPK